MSNQDIFKVLKEEKVMQLKSGIKLAYLEGTSNNLIDVMYGRGEKKPKSAWDVSQGLGSNSELRNKLGRHGVTPNFDENSIAFDLWGFKNKRPFYLGGVDGHIVKPKEEDGHQRRISILLRPDVDRSDDVLGYLLQAVLEELES